MRKIKALVYPLLVAVLRPLGRGLLWMIVGLCTTATIIFQPHLLAKEGSNGTP